MRNGHLRPFTSWILSCVGRAESGCYIRHTTEMSCYSAQQTKAAHKLVKKQRGGIVSLWRSLTFCTSSISQKLATNAL